MGYVLNEEWHGLDRVSSQWCKNQAKAIEKIKADYEEIDKVGLAFLLKEMAERDYITAENAARGMMKCLLCIFVSPNNELRRYWLCKSENFSHIFEIGLDVSIRRPTGKQEIKNELEEYWTEIYKIAVEKVLHKAKYAKSDEFEIEKIPTKSVWTVDDFLTKEPEELLDMLEE